MILTLWASEWFYSPPLAWNTLVLGWSVSTTCGLLWLCPSPRAFIAYFQPSSLPPETPNGQAPHPPKIFKAHPCLVHQKQLHLFFLDKIWESGPTPVQPPKQQLLVRTSLFLWVSWAGKTSEFILLYLALFWSGTNKVSWLFQKSPIVSLEAHPLQAWGWKVTPLFMPLPQERMEQPSKATAPKKHLY